MRRTAAALLMIPCLTLAAQSHRAPTSAQLKADLKKLTAERDALQAKLDAQSALPAQLADAQGSRDQYKAQAAASAQELASLKAMLKENAGDSDAPLKGV